MQTISMNSPVKYSLDLLSPFTLLIGESATGKSLLFDRTRLKVKELNLAIMKNTEECRELNNGAIDFINADTDDEVLNRVLQDYAPGRIVWIDNADYLFPRKSFSVEMSDGFAVADMSVLLSLHQEKKYIIAGRYFYGLNRSSLTLYSLEYDRLNSTFLFCQEDEL